VCCATQGLVVRAAEVDVTETMGPKSRVTLNVPTHSPEAAPGSRKGVGGLATRVRCRTRQARADSNASRTVRNTFESYDEVWEAADQGRMSKSPNGAEGLCAER
jgi:hypothetical protein